MACNRIFRGRVFSGVGEGEFYVSIYGKEIRRVLGIIPYPGTLNVRLNEEDVKPFNECLSRIEPRIIEPPRIPGARLARVKAWRASINGYSAWIVRPDITVYKDDVVEFVAPEYLREKLSLEDGDEVLIELEG